MTTRDGTLTTSELIQTVYKAEVTTFLEWAGKPA